MSEEVFKFLRILVWALPAALAYNSWGVNVGLLTFACQMFSVNPLLKMFAVYKAREGPVEIDEIRKAYLFINLAAGAAYAFFLHWLMGGEPPPPINLGF